MKALVIYESMFGNTKRVAEAIAAGLAESMDVAVAEVGVAPTVVRDVDLLVLGGPTHQFGMSKPASREAAFAETNEPLVSQSIGMREWLDAVRFERSSIAAATFDTKIAKPLPGSAAKKGEKKLRKLGLRIIEEPETFDVESMTGPLIDGEIERARFWGEALASVAAMPIGV